MNEGLTVGGTDHRFDLFDDVPVPAFHVARAGDGPPVLRWNDAAGERFGRPGAGGLAEPVERAVLALAEGRERQPAASSDVLCIGSPDGEERVACRVRAALGGVLVVLDPVSQPDLSGALDEAHRTLERLQSWGHVGFWDVDLDTMTPYWSTQVFAILGLVDPSLRQFLAQVHPDDRELVDQVAARARQQPGPYRAEHRFLRGDETRALSHHIQSVAGPDGTPNRLLGVVRDVTHERALQAEVDAAVSVRNVGLLASSLMHTFKNQLAIALGHSTLAIEAVDRGDAPDREGLAAIQRAANQGIELSRQLLDVGRTPTTTFERIVPSDVLERVASLARPIVGGGNAVLVDVKPESAPMFTDRDRLEQVIIDFVINASDALPPVGGQVCLGYRETTIDVANGNGVAPGRYGVFSVTDDGAGMEESIRLRCTQPFFSTKANRGGSGIGLTTASVFAQELGGRLDIESAPGVGTTVELLLPLAPPVEPVPRVGAPPRVVLLAGDVRDADATVQMLSDAGVQAVVARDRTDVDRFTRTEPIDAVVVDRGLFDAAPVGSIPVLESTFSRPPDEDLLRRLRDALRMDR